MSKKQLLCMSILLTALLIVPSAASFAQQPKPKTRQLPTPTTQTAFYRHHGEAALVLLCCVLVTVVTMVLILGPLGVHDVAITRESPNYHPTGT